MCHPVRTSFIVLTLFDATMLNQNFALKKAVANFSSA